MVTQNVIKVSFKEQMLQAREEAIIRSVNRLLAEKGFEAMTVDEVAADVGIAKASLYKHFPSKEDLACAAMVSMMRRAQTFLQTLPLDAPPVANLRAVVAWTMGLKLAGEMPSLPSHNSSLRTTLSRTSRGPIVEMTAWVPGLKKPKRKARSTRSYPPLPCSTPCLPAPATRCWSF